MKKYGVRLHSDEMCVTSPVEATLSKNEENLECWATVMGQFILELCVLNKKL
jgi:hypothetical protein